MAIEAKNFDEKDILISRFYTLRAGLSVIAEETEKLREANDEIYSLERKEKNQSKEVHDKESSFKRDKERKLEELRKTENSLNHYKNESRNQIYVKQKELEKIENSYQKSKAFAFKIFIAFIASFIAYIATPFFGHSANIMFAISLTICFWLLIYKLKKRKQQREGMEKLSAEIRQLKKEAQRTINQLTETQQEIVSWEESEFYSSQAWNSAIKLQQQYQKQLQATQQKLHREVVVPCTALAKEVREALLRDFSDVLTEADWENVDLLIFYLNTGRADNLKEALQLVDRQRQTDQISRSILQASQYISSTLNANFQRLGTLIYHGMEQISSNISAMHSGIVQSIEQNNQYLNNLNQSLMNTNAQIGKLRDEVASQGNNLLHAQYINNCLLSQSNRSSRDLMNELRYNQRYWIK